MLRVLREYHSLGQSMLNWGQFLWYRQYLRSLRKFKFAQTLIQEGKKIMLNILKFIKLSPRLLTNQFGKTFFFILGWIYLGGLHTTEKDVPPMNGSSGCRKGLQIYILGYISYWISIKIQIWLFLSKINIINAHFVIIAKFR